MNNESELTLTCSLRFIVESLEEREKFKNKYKEYSISGRAYFKDKTKYVIAVKLEEDIDMLPLEKYIGNYCGKLDHDFFISLSTINDSEIVEIPGFVVDCIRRIGGKVNFSFTCIDDE